MTLASALHRIGSDAIVGAALGVHRTVVWRWRNGKDAPSTANLIAIRAELKKRGVDVEIEDLVPAKKRRKRSSKAA